MQDLKALRHPKFWGYWLLLGLIRLLVMLPYGWLMFFGRWVGRLVFSVVKHRRIVAETNFRVAFPELSDTERRVLMRRFAESVGQGFFETGMAWFWSEKRLRRISHLQGDSAALAKVQDGKTPVVLVGSHSTLLELGVRLLGIYVDSAGMYRPLSNAFFEQWIKRQRSRAATELVYFKDMRHVLRILQNGGNLWYALDQDIGRRNTVFVPFFGIETSSVNILPALAQRTGAAWIPVFIWREKGGYSVKILPEILPVEGESDADVMTRVNAVYEAEIRQHPEQYFWVHRRFKTRPDANEKWYPED